MPRAPLRTRGAGYLLQHQELLDVPAVYGDGGAFDRSYRDVHGVQVPHQRNAGALLDSRFLAQLSSGLCRVMGLGLRKIAPRTIRRPPICCGGCTRQTVGQRRETHAQGMVV